MAVGIIAEYNPFHNGHLYHLNEIKRMYPNEEIILVMSGNFTERGDISILNKWDKKSIALQAGIDLVIEIPYAFVTQSADYFAYAAITLLEKLKVEKFVFGSETNDIDILEKVAVEQLNNEMFDPLVKIYMKMGENYPTALSKALYDLTNEKLTLPNDLLGISYIKIIKKNNYKIKPISIKRKNNYNNKVLTGKYSSATSIRQALKNNENIDNYVPEFVLPYLKNINFQDDYFKFIKYKILTDDNLEIYHGISEGIDKKIKKEIINSRNYEELINNIKSRRYTYSRINRILNHILCGYTKDDNELCKDIEYIRVLGFNTIGKKYLNKIKKEVDIPIISNYSKYKSRLMELELKATCAYASIYDEDIKKKIIMGEYIFHPMYKENDDEKN